MKQVKVLQGKDYGDMEILVNKWLQEMWDMYESRAEIIDIQFHTATRGSAVVCTCMVTYKTF